MPAAQPKARSRLVARPRSPAAIPDRQALPAHSSMETRLDAAHRSPTKKKCARGALCPALAPSSSVIRFIAQIFLSFGLQRARDVEKTCYCGRVVPPARQLSMPKLTGPFLPSMVCRLSHG